ncbi:MBL fold metallo-hydrolase [Natronoflexus pectinivorans]|uniref:7, 8-dihydropterin-6-yl-methyl-4-(Beta-D-ribofuranosyl)aminobenzene 5'-phosphate synthase n=1 Tax=Natronoflexus pectinivorans TaxID=682526 RepID=A0A4R2GGS5_9BACT|nr:MBL fold metallo-hydrolase [Natronoflexus pectinivorans]TCO07301.1 7,8-dihydropterin-6-yl-methyl-4-(beta-D-ribofuranosyl)aminobenzene 5'-phosphate synthase [Natronoflexus pectinivorans]
MRFTILIDNNPNPETDLLTEHGLSIFIESGKTKILYDTGNSDAFIANAKKLGIDIRDVDYLVLSHGHRDHTGGLGAFLEINKKAVVFLSERIKNQSFYSTKLSDPKDISTDHSLFNKFKNRFEFIGQNGLINENIALINSFNQIYPLPKGNRHLLTEINNRLIPDNFNHEIALTLKQNHQVLVFSACTHNGLLNTINAVSSYWKNKTIALFIGGTHLIDSNSALYENEEELSTMINVLHSTYPDTLLITGHCTGKRAMNKFEEELGEKFDRFFSGYSKSI